MANKIKPPTWFDTTESLKHIWEILNCYRENCINGSEYDEEWDNITTSMNWIEIAVKTSDLFEESEVG